MHFCWIDRFKWHHQQGGQVCVCSRSLTEDLHAGKGPPISRLCFFVCSLHTEQSKRDCSHRCVSVFTHCPSEGGKLAEPSGPCMLRLRLTHRTARRNKDRVKTPPTGSVGGACDYLPFDQSSWVRSPLKSADPETTEGQW